MAEHWGVPYDCPPAGDSDPKEHPEWTDVLGQTYRPGDHVAIAIINDRSPQMVIGEVIRINAVNSKKQVIVERRYWIEDCSPDEKGARFNRHAKRLIEPDGSPSYWENYEAWQVSRHEDRPSCTVTVRPMIDARGFYRWGGRSYRDAGPAQEAEEVRPVTYKIPQNIIKVELPDA